MTTFSNLWNDVRYSARSLSARPTFSLIAALTLALGIGVNVAIYSLFEQILLRPLPVVDPDSLVNFDDLGSRQNGLSFGSPAGGSDSVFSYPMFRDLERGQEPFVGIAAHRIFDASLSTGEQARRATGVFVSGSYFSVLGLQPALGRLLGPQDDRVDGEAQSVVLSHAHWQSDFGRDPSVIGRTLAVNGTALTIVGVAPPGFHGTTVGTRASVFVPITFRSTDAQFAVPDHGNRAYYWLHLFARLAPGVDRDEAAAAINPLYRGIINEVEVPLLTNPSEDEVERFRSKSLVLGAGARGQSMLLVPVRDRLAMLLAVSGTVLLLCCANVAGLILIRGSARRGEIAVRAALGATRGRLTSLLLIESLLLALPAAVLGLPVALLTLRGLAGGVPGVPPAAFDVELSMGAALMAIAVAVLSALLFGLLPLRSLARTDPAKTLQAYGVRLTAGKGVTFFRTTLASVQIALSMALLAMTGVFAQSLANIARVDLGVDVDTVLTFRVSPDSSGYSAEETTRLYERLEQEIAATPGVASVASSMMELLSGNAMIGGSSVAGAEAPARVGTHLNYVGTGFFGTLGIPLIAGRDFAVADVATSAKIVVINERLAERLGLGRDVVGQRIRIVGNEAEVIGLVANAQDEGVTNEIAPQVFMPRAQSPGSAASFYIRSEGPPASLISAVRATVTRVAPEVPITDLNTMREQARENLATERYVAGASTAFAVLATALAGLGLYGVLAYTVAQRSREIGLRFALGAPAGRIRGMLLRQMGAVTLIGIALGIVVAWLLGRAARSLLFGVDAADPIALAGAAVVLTAVTLGAAYFPSRRASRVDPIVVLRYE
jgi:putative ABC transport system permease protein